MAHTVQIICENNNSQLFVEMGSSLLDLLKMLSLKNQNPFLAAYVNNRIKELDYRIYTPISVRFIDITHFEGMRVYQRTLFFIMHKAVLDLYPDKKLKIKQSVVKGFYCEIEGFSEISAEEIEALQNRMQEIVAQNIPIVRQKMLTKNAIPLYQKYHFTDKLTLLETRPHLYVTLYMLADLPGYYYGALAPSTGYIHLFDLRKYHNGIYIAVPKMEQPEQLEKMIPQDKMFDLFQEYKQWVNIIGVSNIGALNSLIMTGNSSDLIKIAEALHEKKLANIADSIASRQREQGVRIVLISGPSSSGKTTFGKRLSIQLRVLELNPVMISLDDYFVDRDQTPRDENGAYDFEALEALNIAEFNRDLTSLLTGKTVEMRTFDFTLGKRTCDIQKRLHLEENSIIVVEGIHALNPNLTPSIPAELKFKIYVSALTSISMDDQTRIATTDNRLIRRIVRDHKYRNYSAVDTLRRWGSVRKGEDKHIFPYQEEADVMFNSALFYEMSVLKTYVDPLLHEVPDNLIEYGEARRLLRFLDYFIPISETETPPTSILREFVGGSSFQY